MEKDARVSEVEQMVEGRKGVEGGARRGEILGFMVWLKGWDVL